MDFARLEFDARCLDFYQSARVPRTLSYTQVAERLYDRSVHRYRHFRKHLDEAISILEPVIARLGYAIN